MNYIKAQQEILKEYLKDNRVIFCKIGEKVVYGDAHLLYITPADKVGIEFESHISEKTIENILNSKYDTDVYLTSEIYQKDKVKLRCFTDNKELKIYVNEKLLKNFDLKHCTFKGDSPIHGVHIYEYGVQVGYVLPMRKIH